MGKNLDASAEEVINMSLCERIKHNYREIKNGFKIREFHRAVLYFLILGALVPSFTDYFYYYLTDISGITKFQYAMVQLSAYIMMVFGAILYNFLLSDSEIRCMMVIACITNLIGAFMSLIFVRGITLGMSPYMYTIFSTAVTEILYILFITLPSQVLFAKMIPSNIEASMFSITTGITNFGNLFMARQIGNLVNLFFDVERENLEDLWKLYIVQCGCCLLPLLFLCLIPNRKQIAEVQKVIQYMEKEG